ncbi:MAG: GntR family transcriptional regulator, partial [Pedobacter sp.]
MLVNYLMSINNEFEYLKLADSIQDSISNGEYDSGTKLPSVRTLKRNHNLSISTVLRAFYELEKRGLIIAKEKYGYYVNSFSKQGFLLDTTQKCKLKAE